MARSLGARHGRHKQRRRKLARLSRAANCCQRRLVLVRAVGLYRHARRCGCTALAVFILAQTADKTLIVATLAVFYFVVNYVKLVPYHFIGQLNAGNLTTALLFAPLAPLGVLLGVWLHRRISAQLFYRVSYALLFATGAKLFFDALTR